MNDRRFPVFGPMPWVMGVVNVTPDSFSDGGRWDSTELAVAHGRRLIADGAAIIDVGGESTRPGAHRVDAATEMARVVPVIRAMAADGVICSVDTSRASVAAAAVQAGAAIVNDVSGGLADPDMIRVVADAGVPWVLMHWRGHSTVMDQLTTYNDVTTDVCTELLHQVGAAIDAGIDERSLILDPGLGFAKTSQHNWQLLARFDELARLGLPVLLGASRKRFLGDLLATPGSDGPRLRPTAEREVATAATSLLAAQRGAWAVRVHEPQPTLDAMRVATAGSDEPAEPGGAVPDEPLAPGNLVGMRYGQLEVRRGG